MNDQLIQAALKRLQANTAAVLATSSSAILQSLPGFNLTGYRAFKGEL